jgi:WD40 repeat protein/serine/threonine protein kinase
VTDDEVTEAFAEQLAACDDRLDRRGAPDAFLAETLPHELHADLEPAVDCLRWLNELRAQRRRPPARGKSAPADAASIRPTSFGRFEVREELGHGGFGMVFRAFDPFLKRDVALKLPRPDCLFDAELRRRFLHEGQAAAALAHPNIIPIHEAGEINGICYLASAYCAGPSLAHWLGAHTGPVSPSDAARLVADLADGVQHAHAHGILHRDLKPGNILLECVAEGSCSCLEHARAREGQAPPPGKQAPNAHRNEPPRASEFIPRITDFGLAKIADGPAEQTRSGTMLGTPAYMAPEQAEGRVSAIGPATDVYALGVILYELLTRTRPFIGESALDVLRRVTSDEPASVRRMRREVPRDLESICLKCLEKEPRRRYATAGALAADLRRYLHGEPALARTPSPLERTVKWMRRRPAVAALIAVSVGAIVCLLVGGLWHFHAIEEQNQQLRLALAYAKEQREIASRKAAEVSANAYATQVRVAADLLEAGQVGQMGTLLNLLRPAQGEKDERGFAWYYLWRLARNEQWLRGHHHGVQSLDVSTDGKTLASVDGHSIIVWDVDTGEPRHTLRGFDGRPFTVAISPDGQWVAAANHHKTEAIPTEVRVWNLKTGKLFASHRDTAALPGDVAFAPDSQTLAIPRRPPKGDRAGVVTVWNFHTQEKRMLLADTNVAMAAAFSRDGKTLAVARGAGTNQCQLLLVDARTGNIKLRCTGSTQKAHHLRFARAGDALFSWGGEDTFRVWDVATGRERMSFQPEGPWVGRMAMSADEQTIVTLIGHQNEFEINRIFVRASLAGEPQVEALDMKNRVVSIGLSPDGQILARGRWDSQIHLGRVRPEPPVYSIAAHNEEAWAVAFSPDGRILASASDDASVKLWDAATRKPLASLEGHRSLASCLAYTTDGRFLASGSYDRKVKLWDTATNMPSTVLEGHQDVVRSVAFAPDGRTLASAGRDQTVRLWQVPTGTPLGVMCEHESTVRAVAFSPKEGSLASAGLDRRLILWDLKNQVPVAQVRVNDNLWCVAYSPDGELLAAAGADGLPRFWDKHLRVNRAVVGAHLAGVRSVAFSPDGRTLASGGMDRTVCLWHVASGQKLVSFVGLSHEVNSVAFSPDGRYLAAALHDGTLRLWPAEQ